MSIKHDPGPNGPSGEGEFTLFCIFLSYIFTIYNIVKGYSRNTGQNRDSLPVTEEMYIEQNDDIETTDIWISDTKYIPTTEYRQKFIKITSLGLITSGDYEDIQNNTYIFRFYYFLSGLNWMKITLFFGVWWLLWLFLVCLGLMGVGFKLVGGKDAAKMFEIVDNPISGLMIGILTTVLVQSSSTTTSLIIGLVGADEMTVNTAIPMIMGANIGTSVTNTLVSLSHFGNVEELRRGFAAATIHDCFNLLSVLILLPIQLLTHMFNHITYEMSKNIDACNEDDEKCEKQEFIKPYIKPYYNDIAAYDKKVASYVSQDYCKGRCNDDTTLFYRKVVTDSVCMDDDNCRSIEMFKSSWVDEDNILKEKRLPKYIEVVGNNNTLANYLYNCLVCDNLKPLSNITSLYNTTDDVLSILRNEYNGTTWTVCEDMDYGLCDKRLLKGGIFYRDWHLSDNVAGILSICLSLSGICSVLYLMVKSLNILVRGTAAKWLRKSVSYNGYVSILIGMFLTIMVQSSSITTSVMTPLVAIGLIPLNDMFPLTLGANVGTTVTGIISATVVTSNPVAAWQIALTHMLFNVFGIMIWYPLKVTRNIPIKMATYLGDQTIKNKSFPLLYTVTTFFVVPGIIYGISIVV